MAVVVVVVVTLKLRLIMILSVYINLLPDCALMRSSERQ